MLPGKRTTAAWQGYRHLSTRYRTSLALIRFLQFNVQPRSHSVHKVEVGDDSGSVMDGGINQPRRTQRRDVIFHHRMGRAGELERVVNEGTLSWLKRRAVRIALERRQKFVVSRQRTERLPVMANSVMTMVGDRNGNGQQLAFRSRQFRPAKHQLTIEGQVSCQRLRMQAVNFEDVGDAPARACDFVVGVAERAFRLFFIYNFDPGH